MLKKHVKNKKKTSESVNCFQSVKKKSKKKKPKKEKEKKKKKIWHV